MVENINERNEFSNSCIWRALEKIKCSQDKAEYLRKSCKLIDPPACTTIPFILQTNRGDPFFTWGKIGNKNCFVTIFFKVIRLDSVTGCITLRLLRPNKRLWDDSINSIRPGEIYEVEFVTVTDEGLIINPADFSAIKCFDPLIVLEEREDTSE